MVCGVCALLRPASYFLGTTRLVPSRPWPPHRVAGRRRKGRCIAHFRACRVVGYHHLRGGLLALSVVRWFHPARSPFPEVPKRKKDPLLPVK